jgi:hypothetical protein
MRQTMIIAKHLKKIRLPARLATLCGASLLSFGMSMGCVEICAAWNCGYFDNGDGAGGGNGNLPPGNGGEDSLRVALSLSNTNPIVGEEVVLLCRVVSGETDDMLRFSFQPTPGRLIVDSRQGIGRFIVDEMDVSVQFSFTCMGSIEGASSAISNRVSFIPGS